MMQPYTFDLDANMRPTVYDDHILRRFSRPARQLPLTFCSP